MLPLKTLLQQCDHPAQGLTKGAVTVGCGLDLDRRLKDVQSEVVTAISCAGSALHRSPW